MIRWLIILLTININAFALEAVVTVLETPLFKTNSHNSEIVQYLRKGDIIKIHPSLANERDMEQFSPDKTKHAKILEKMRRNYDEEQDPLFNGKENHEYRVEDNFIPTLDRQGHIAYVLSAHLYIFYEDSREFNQITSKKDPTDYRLEEPLPTNYPFMKTRSLRSQFIIGFTQPNYQSYNYPDEFKAKGYTTPLNLNYTYLKQGPGDYDNRLFIGGTFSFRTHKNSYLFYDNRTSEERGIKIGIGPTISYDVFRGEINRINFSHSLLVNFYESLNIKQSENDERNYTGNSISGLISTQYHRKHLLKSEIDFVAGTAMELNSGTNYKARNAGQNSSWWQSTGNDEFRTGISLIFNIFLGLQSEY